MGLEFEIGPEGQRIYVLKEQSDVYPNAAAKPIPDDPGVAFIAALDLMNRTMMKHPRAAAIVQAWPEDERDELRAGGIILIATAWLDNVKMTLEGT